jgi:hypothetical protein
MNREILLIAEGIKDAYEGEPWFGKSLKELLNGIDERIVFEKPNGQHSIVELLWHMITWKEFTISRLRKDATKSIQYFEEYDWRQLDHSDETLWQQGLQTISKIHNELVEVVQQQKDDILSQRVLERNYDFRKLLNGIKEHDIYHSAQIAYIKKLLQK